MLLKRNLRISLVVFALLFASAAFLHSDRAVEAQQASTEVADNVLVQTASLPVAERKLTAPIKNAGKRITKKTFGLEVHPETSPVPNDKFHGLHAGVDFETFEDEAEVAVPITAACTGPLVLKKIAKGYGGVAIQHCRINNEDVSVIYGHMEIGSITTNEGNTLKTGTYIGNLGKGNSPDTDGARKHLHFGLRKGTTWDIRGYVKEGAELDEYLDPMKYIIL